MLSRNLPFHTLRCCLSLGFFILGFQMEKGFSDTVQRYDLFETSFQVNLPYGNPYDASEVQVDASIRLESNQPVTVPCFFDGGKWGLRFTPSKSGTYTYTIMAKTPSHSETIKTGSFQCTDTSRDPKGFVTLPDKTSRHFVFDNGESYFPLGENVGWVQWYGNPQIGNWIGYLEECSQAGMNWIRIWMCPWGMTELTWTKQGDRYFGYEKYDQVNARVIDGIFREAQKRGIYIQWVINHHGQYSIDHNPEWQNNPFNRKNGGFLDNPWDFFTDDRARLHYRNRLRYLVARWGYSTHLFAWEFWNEVNLTSHFNFPVVKQWHEEMAQYLRRLDPYSHLISTSASGDFEDLYTIRGLDFIQTHAYTKNLVDKLVSTSKKRLRDYPDTPHFMAEMAYDWRGPTKDDHQGVSLHNQLWASVHATSDAGTAMTWWWDNWVRPKNLYFHFRALAKFVEGIDWAKEHFRPQIVEIDSPPQNKGPFTFVPPIGWGSSRRTRFTFHPDGQVEGGAECTRFVHGDAHRNMAPNPLFSLTVEEPVTFRFQVEQAAKSGAQCEVWLDGKKVFQRAFAPAEKDSTMGNTGDISVVVPAGRHTLAVKNPGRDWFRVAYYQLDPFVQRPMAFARGNRDRVIVWIADRLHQWVYLSENDVPGSIAPGTLVFPELANGEFTVQPFDTYQGRFGPSMTIRTNEKGLVVPFPSFENDMAFHIVRTPTAVHTPLR